VTFKISKLTLFCGLVVALFLLGPSHVKADTITFDDLIVPNNGAQQIAADRYRSQGVLINGSMTTPFIVQSGSATSPPNFLFGGHSTVTSSINISVFFVFPGTATNAATNFVSFDVITTGDAQNAFWQAIFLNEATVVGELSGTGNSLVSFSTQNNAITRFVLVYNNFDFATNRPYTGLLGMDNLTYNTPLAEPVPEPATLILLGTGLAGTGAMIRKRRKAGEG
jgi:hypothetical protein